MQDGNNSFWSLFGRYLLLVAAVVSPALPSLVHWVKARDLALEPARVLAIVVSVAVLSFCFGERQFITRHKDLRERKGYGADRFKYYVWIAAMAGALLVMVDLADPPRQSETLAAFPRYVLYSLSAGLITFGLGLAWVTSIVNAAGSGRPLEEWVEDIRNRLQELVRYAGDNNFASDENRADDDDAANNNHELKVYGLEWQGDICRLEFRPVNFYERRKSVKKVEKKPREQNAAGRHEPAKGQEEVAQITEIAITVQVDTTYVVEVNHEGWITCLKAQEVEIPATAPR